MTSLLMTTPMRLSYPYLATPKAANPNTPGGKPQYCFDGLIVKDELKKSKEWQAIASAAIEASKSAGQTFSSDQVIRMIFKDADLPNRNGRVPSESNPDYKGCYIISFKSQYKPQMVSANVSSIPEDQITTTLYPGCWVRVVAKPYAYNAPQNKGVALGFDMIQKVKDDNQFGGARRLAAEVFEPVAVGADDPDNYEFGTGNNTESNGFFSFDN